MRMRALLVAGLLAAIVHLGGAGAQGTAEYGRLLTGKAAYAD